jgi:large subunit ribosomal protein L10
VVKVEELAGRFRAASGAVFADFRGLTVQDSIQLRRSLRGADASLAVAKNTLTRLAVREVGLDDAVALLEGPTAIAFLGGDAVAGAKAVLDLTKRFPALVVKGALIEGRVFGADEAQSLATLEQREVSLAKVAGILQAPLSRIAYLLRAPLQRIAYALAERGRQGGAPEPEATEARETEAVAVPEREEPESKAEAPEPDAESESEAAATTGEDESTEHNEEVHDGEDDR